MSFSKMVVLITGGSAGIGATTAELFAKECATVAIVGRNEANLNKVAKCCESFGAPSLAIKADIATDEAANLIVKKTIDKFGKLDVLVNNAGILREAALEADNFLKIFDDVMNVNIRGAARLTYYAAPHIIKTKGNIINISSIAGLCTQRPKNIAYRTSKAALNHFSRSVALELASHGVRVNSICPGPTHTGLFDGLAVTADDLKSKAALNRVLDTIEIANMILYLASDKAKGITGSNFLIDNGVLLMYK